MKDLEAKIWYRVLKVVYIGAYVFLAIWVFGLTLALWEEGILLAMGAIIFGGGIGAVIIELIKRAILYIAIGNKK
ncbi:MAG: hypothetical protein G01um10143_753 [Parcubacteria group bacterium Gr01-1014_3]|nr:MAG: hypothetical protein G01um10143_753 [Parcubacteria group bacterium Gr01-1014_3]